MIRTPPTPLNDAHQGGYFFRNRKSAHTMFNKPALTVDQQINLLIKRGMKILDRNFAQQNLSHINYYRLRAYWLPFEIQPTTTEAHEFRPGTTLEHVIALYTFDRELRLLLLDAIERIEISLRAQW